MAEKNVATREVDQFILEEIDSVPHLEALLLLWNSRPREWSLDEMAKGLYISTDRTQVIIQDLKHRGLVATDSSRDRYCYNPDSSRDTLIDKVDRTYRRELVRISTMIHSKAPSAVREFARAFKLKKD
jgi:predicted transcriptional regulator